MADTWETLTGLPAGHHSHATGVVGTDLYIAGGNVGGSQSAVARKYDSLTDTWTNVASMPSAVQAAAGGGIGSYFYVANGITSGSTLNTCLRYDPSTDSWSSMANANYSKQNVGSCVHDDKLFVFGGASTNTAEYYDPATDSWTTISVMPAARRMPACFSIGGYIYVAGGEDTLNNATATLYRYDPVADSWTTLTSMSQIRSGAFIGGANSKLWVAGGSATGLGGVGITSTEEYDLSTDTWTTRTSMPLGLHQGGGGEVIGRYLYVPGGIRTSATTNHYRYLMVDTLDTVVVIPTWNVMSKIF